MTGLERFKATMERRPVDRPPVDFIATPEMEERLVRDLGLPDREALYRRVGSDCRRIGPVLKPHFPGEYYAHPFVRETAPGRFIDTWGIAWQKSVMKAGDVFFDVVDFPLKNASSLRELEEYPWPDPEKEWDFSTIHTQAHAHPELAVLSSTSAVFDDAWRMVGIDKFMMDLALEPDFIHLLLRKVCDYWLKYARLILENAGGRIDLMWTSDDLGTQNGLFVSRDMCKEFIMPHIKERADLFKKYGAHAAMHSCGGIYPIIPDIIECGVEVLNPIQPAAKGMDRRKIKAEFGKELVFHGSIDQQNILVFGKPEDVVRETRECMEALGKGGGYIVAPSHALETDIPTENVLALYGTALLHQ